MNVRHLLVLPLLLCLHGVANSSEVDKIGKVIDDFHDAAAHGDKDRYLGHLSEDAVFMGTDEWERWPKQPDFSTYVESRFENGRGWNYKSVERKIRVSNSADVAWFDEVVFSETNGRFRGTGVLTMQNGSWKISHYAMSFLILNENWDEVIELTRKTKVQLENSPPSE
jgi:ketosteroid isomerase-like protein